MTRYTHFRSVLLPPLALGALAFCVAGCESKATDPAPAPSAEAPPLPSNLPGLAAPPGANPHEGNPHQQSPHGAGPTAPETAEPPVAIAWDVPETWTEMPPRPMRKATYKLDGKAGAAEVAIFYFGPGQGGDVEANIARWVGQFSNLPEGAAKRSEREVGGLKHFSVSVEKGSFASGMPGAPASTQDNWGMQATIVQAAGGQYFFKLTGPSETVAEHSAAFAKMLDSVREK